MLAQPTATQLKALTDHAVVLLQKLVQTPSFSKEEQGTAAILTQTLQAWGLAPQQAGNNIYAWATPYAANRPTVWLVSHHDTVKPNKGYTRNPFGGEIENGMLYGLGSNDAGGPLVAMLAAAKFLATAAIPINLVILACAQEEISGPGGISSLLPHLPAADLVLVGEPTRLQAAVAEKGLLVLDCVAKGVAGHAARQEGVNALYEALPDLAWFRDFSFERISPTLGPMHMAVTQIEAGSQHNVVPDSCRFTVDIRVTDAYTHTQVLDIIRQHVKAEITPRSLRLQPSATPAGHKVLAAIESMGIATFGSPTLSDQALIPYPSVKIGPGDSARSHTANEFIYVQEIEQAIALYISLLKTVYP